MQLIASWLIIVKEILEACILTGISFLQGKSRMSKQRRYHLEEHTFQNLYHLLSWWRSYFVGMANLLVMFLIWRMLYSWNCIANRKYHYVVIAFVGYTYCDEYLGFSIPNLPFPSQPADWDDREYIEDPNDVKPKVQCFTSPTSLPSLTQ